jgi:hypothetical protein
MAIQQVNSFFVQSAGGSFSGLPAVFLKKMITFVAQIS